jgi:O-antigen polysaccharide polymerase Wzy
MLSSDLVSDLSSLDWFSAIALSKNRFRLSTFLLHVFVFGGLIFALNIYAQSELTKAERFLASSLVLLPILPLELWLVGIDRTVPVVPLYSLIYSGMFGISIFLVDRLSTGIWGNPISNQAIEIALMLLIAGLLLLFVGYYGPLPTLIGAVIPRFTLSWRNPNIVRISLWAMTLVGLIFAFPNLPGLPLELAQLGSFGGDLFTLGVCGLLALQLTQGIGTTQSILLWFVFVPLRIVVGLASGLTGAGLLPALTLCLVYASIRHKIPWTAIVLGACAFFVFRPVEGAFRVDNAASGVVADRPLSDKFHHFLGLTETIVRLAFIKPEVVLQVSAHRLALTPTFAGIIEDTPRIVPYWGGATYYPILFKLIPRFIYPDKPEEITGQEFGHRYGLIDLENLNTSVNLPQIVELYANFGVAGVLLGMFLFGVIIRTVLNIYLHPNMGFGGTVAVFYLGSKLIDFQSAFSLIYGALPWEVTFLGLIHLFVTIAELDTSSIFISKRDSIS